MVYAVRQGSMVGQGRSVSPSSALPRPQGHRGGGAHGAPRGEVTRARSQAVSVQNGTPAERAAAENALSGALGRLMAVAESYPDLKASQNFVEFQRALEETENEIALSRRYYNGAARNLNIAVESFPSVLIANQFNFSKVEYFEIEEATDRAVPKVSFDK